jgi:hypothetical protein
MQEIQFSGWISEQMNVYYKKTKRKMDARRFQ